MLQLGYKTCFGTASWHSHPSRSRIISNDGGLETSQASSVDRDCLFCARFKAQSLRFRRTLRYCLRLLPVRVSARFVLIIVSEICGSFQVHPGNSLRVRSYIQASCHLQLPQIGIIPYAVQCPSDFDWTFPYAQFDLLGKVVRHSSSGDAMFGRPGPARGHHRTTSRFKV